MELGKFEKTGIFYFLRFLYATVSRSLKIAIEISCFGRQKGAEQRRGPLSSQQQNHHLFPPKFICLYFYIGDKLHPIARAYCLMLVDTNLKWTSICLIRGVKLWVYGLMQTSRDYADNR